MVQTDFTSVTVEISLLIIFEALTDFDVDLRDESCETFNALDLDEPTRWAKYYYLVAMKIFSFVFCYEGELIIFIIQFQFQI